MKKEFEEMPTFFPVKSKQDLFQLNGYEIENIIENIGSRKGKSTNIFLKRKLPDGRTVHRELMIVSNGKKFMTDEY